MTTTASYLAAEYVSTNDTFVRRQAMEWLIEEVPDADERTRVIERALEERDAHKREVERARLLALGWG